MTDVIEIGSDGCFELPDIPVEPEVWKPRQTKQQENVSSPAFLPSSRGVPYIPLLPHYSSQTQKPTVPNPDKSFGTPSEAFKAQSQVELYGNTPNPHLVLQLL